MNAYICNAALICEDCAEETARDVFGATLEECQTMVDDASAPEGPYADGGGEADSPQHCDNHDTCRNAIQVGDRKVGCFLENPLTSEGRKYVESACLEALRAGRVDSVALDVWAPFYRISLPPDDVCDECGETIPDVAGGGLANRHHKCSCSLHEPNDE